MGRIVLKEISICGLRSVVEPATIHFPESGLVCAIGVNKDTGGSSGSGKTSLNLAVAYLFGFCPFPAAALQSWLTESPFSVTGKFMCDEGEVILSRGARTSMTVAGEPVLGGIKAIDARLRQLVGVDPEMLAALTYRGQQKRGLFLSKTDSEKKEFLTALLGLDRFEAAAALTSTRIQGIEARFNALALAAEALSVRYDQASPGDCVMGDWSAAAALASKKTTEKLAADIDVALCEALLKEGLAAEAASKERALKTWQPRIAEAQARVASVQNVPVAHTEDAEETRLAGLLDQCNARVVTAKREQDEGHAKARNAILGIEAVIRGNDNAGAKIPILKQQLDTVVQNLQQIRAQKCPTCLREWLQSDAKLSELVDLKSVLETQIAYAESGMRMLPEIRKKLEEAKSELAPSVLLSRLEQARQKLTQDVAVIQQTRAAAASVLLAEQARARAEAKAVVDGLNLELANELATAGTDLPRLRAACDAAKAKAWALSVDATALERECVRVQHENEIARSRFESKLKVYNDLGKELAQARTQAAEAEAELKQERDFAALIGNEGFLGSIFDEILVEISDETNKILAGVANTRHCTVEFRSEKTTAKGLVKKTITPYVTVAGHPALLNAGLSGGMISAVELAVDLAVGAVISRRTGTWPGWLILDEAFEGLGPVEKESCMEILQQYAQDRMVLIVDHDSQFKQMFQKTLVIEYKNGYSTIQEQK